MVDSLAVLKEDKSLADALSKLRLFVGRLQANSGVWDKLLRSPVLYPSLTYAAELADCPDNRLLMEYTKPDVQDYAAFVRAVWQACHIIDLC